MSNGSRIRKLRRELRKVENGAVPSEWLIRRCFRDETRKTLELRRKIFNLLCPPEPPALFTQLNRLSKLYFNPRIVEQFNKASLFYKYVQGGDE